MKTHVSLTVRAYNQNKRKCRALPTKIKRSKTALPMSRFESLKTLMKSIDQLVFEKLKKKVKTLNGVSERSDCMLAKYADGGRFQRHIDNTTKDGRKLTLLCYLNPDKWDESDGGSLRLHPNSDPVDIFPEVGDWRCFSAT